MPSSSRSGSSTRVDGSLAVGDAIGERFERGTLHRRRKRDDHASATRIVTASAASSLTARIAYTKIGVGS